MSLLRRYQDKKKEIGAKQVSRHPVCEMGADRNVRDAYFHGLVFAAYANDDQVDANEQSRLDVIAVSLELTESDARLAIQRVGRLGDDGKMGLIEDCARQFSDAKVAEVFLSEFKEIWVLGGGKLDEYADFQGQLMAWMGEDVARSLEERSFQDKPNDEHGIDATSPAPEKDLSTINIERMKESFKSHGLALHLPGGELMEFCFCPAGKFLMGSPDEEAVKGCDELQHVVILTKDFWIGKYPVTQRQWMSVMGTDPSNDHDPANDLPVTNVTWNDCQSFIRLLNAEFEKQYREERCSLPTEAQWEYACRATTTTPFNFGSKFVSQNINCDGHNRYPGDCNDSGKYLSRPSKVGRYCPNAFGLYDMHGNVREWCRDWYAQYDESDATDPKGPDDGFEKVCRGGGWYDEPGLCRSAARAHYGFTHQDRFTGFRIVCTVSYKTVP